MKILFKDIISNQGQIKYSIDNGITWTTCDIETVRDGITIPNNTPLENIKAKAVISDMSNIKDVSNLSGSLGIAETPIILVSVSGYDYYNESDFREVTAVPEGDPNYGQYTNDGESYYNLSDLIVIDNTYYYVDSSSGTASRGTGHYEGERADGKYYYDVYSRIFIFDEHLEATQSLSGSNAYEWANEWNCTSDNIIDTRNQYYRSGYNLAFRKTSTDVLYAYVNASEALSDYEIVLTYVTNQGPVDVVYSLGTADKLINPSINEFAE